jgi:phosphatidylinositol alpha-1,6-mannosyltransferase
MNDPRTARLVVLAPSLFGSEPGGIEAVSRFAARTADALGRPPPFLVAANDAPADVGGRREAMAFGRNYVALLMWTIWRARTRIGQAGGVICLHAGLLPAARILGRGLACRYVLFAHGQEVWRPARWRERWGGARCSGIIANSAYTLERARSVQTWMVGRPAVVCPLGLLESIERKPVETEPRRAVVLAVGQVRRGEWKRMPGGARSFGKGFDVVLDAVAQLARGGMTVWLEVVTGGDAVDELRAEIAERGLSKIATLRERVSAAELDAAYRRARVFCLPSEQEGFGLVFVEAMARGTPCVAIASGAAAEVICDGSTGFLVAPRDGAAVAARIARLCNDEIEWQRMSRRALADVDGRFSTAVVQQRFGAALQRLLGVGAP